MAQITPVDRSDQFTPVDAKVDLAYSTYSNFDLFKRKDGMPITEFIIEYERLHTQCKKYDMTYPDSILVFKLLDCANLTVKDRQLILTAVKDRTFTSMKSALKRIFGDSSGLKLEDSDITVKQEAAYIASNYHSGSKSVMTRPNVTGKPSTSRLTGYRPRPNGNNQSLPVGIESNGSKQKGTNPLDRNGKRTKCMICQSVFHWVKDCPRINQENVKIVDDDDDEQCNTV